MSNGPKISIFVTDWVQTICWLDSILLLNFCRHHHYSGLPFVIIAILISSIILFYLFQFRCKGWSFSRFNNFIFFCFLQRVAVNFTRFRNFSVFQKLEERQPRIDQLLQPVPAWHSVCQQWHNHVVILEQQLPLTQRIGGPPVTTTECILKSMSTCAPLGSRPLIQHSAIL